MPNEADSSRIVFVYNADQGFFNALSDTAHKIFSPATYQCGLCRFTYSLTGMVLPWKEFVDSLNEKPVFLHRSEFKQAYPDLAVDLPVIFRERGNQRDVVLTAKQITECGDVDGLIRRVSERLAEMSAG